MKSVVKLILIILILFSVFMTHAFSETDKNNTYEFIEGSPGTYSIEGPQFLLDGNVATKWCRKMNGECYVVFKTNKPISINGYILTKADDEEKYPARSPLQWSFYGANSSSAPKRNSKSWELIDKHNAQDKSMSDSVSWNSYAFIHDENLPRYEYYMLVIDKTLGDQYLQLSELRLICNNTLEVPLVVSANPNKAIVALGTLQYDDSCFELVPSEDIYSDTIVFGGSLTPIQRSEERIVQLKLKRGKEWPTDSSVFVKITSAYDIHETEVSKLMYSQLYISTK